MPLDLLGHRSAPRLPAPEELDPIAARTRNRDLAACVLGAAMLSVFEMGPAIAKRGFHASDFEIALISTGQCLGLLFSFFVAHLAARHRKMPLVFWPELLARICLGLMFFIQPAFALGFVLLHVTAQTLQQMTIPARITIYRLNYPDRLRGRIVGRNRQVLLVISSVLALAMSLALEWSEGRQELVRVLGRSPVDPGLMVNYLVPSLALLGLLGSFLFRSIPVRESGSGAAQDGSSLARTVARFWRVWKQDAAFRRYESFFLVFGFANIMSLPLIQIHAVDNLGATYFDLALINVVLVQGFMALTMVFWGRRLDRHPPARLRGILNLIFAVDLLILTVAPTIEWVFLGRIFRGIAFGGGTLVWMLGALYYARSEKDVPVYLGIHSFLTGLRWGLAPFVGVWLKNLVGGSVRPIFGLSFVVVVVTAVLMIRDSEREELHPPLREEPMPVPRTQE